ncbi:hypothetical protein C2S52_009340 [Perilla frutescens var. hirtella]|nr:hypothetical protein C2S52_009340 [Perilla frutescens var. hirtella]
MTVDIQSHRSSAVVDGTHRKELQDNQKEFDQRWQAECLKREATQLILQEQITAVTQMQEGDSYLLNKGKVTLATKNFEGRAATWFLNLSSRCDSISWEQFVDVVAARFEDIRETKKVVELNKLKHTGNYMDYVNKFEELKEFLLKCNREAYSEAYFVACFLSGLSDELRAAVLMFNPTTLKQAVELRESQFLTLKTTNHKLKGADQAYNQSWTNSYPKEVTSSPLSPSQTLVKEPVCLQSSSTIEDDPGPKGFRDGVHVSINTIQGRTKPHNNSWVNVSSKMSEEEKLAYMQPLVTVGNDPGPNELIGEGEITDSDTTLSFIKEGTSEKLGGEIKEAISRLIQVASDQKLISFSKKVGIKVEGHLLNHSSRLVQHEGCEINLGGHWLKFIFHHSLFTLEGDEMEGIYVVYVQTSSHQEIQDGCQAINIVSYSRVKEVVFNYESNLYFEKVTTSKIENPTTFPKYKLTGGLQRRRWSLAVQNNQELSIGQSLVQQRNIMMQLLWEEFYQLRMAKKVESIAGGENGVANVFPMVFTAASPWQVVGFSKANDVAMFYKTALGVEKVSRNTHPKRKSEQKLPHIISAYLKIESSIVVVFDLTGDSSSPIRSAVNSGVFCPETEEVEAAVVGGKLQIGEFEEEISEKKKARRCEGVIPLSESLIPNGGGLFQQLLGSILGLRKVQQQGKMVVLLQVQVRVPPGIERLDFSSWEECKSLIKKINASDPWGQGSHKGGSNVVTQLCKRDEGVMAKKKKRIDGDDCNDQDSIFGARREK